jgi:hypothetical protein
MAIKSAEFILQGLLRCSIGMRQEIADKQAKHRAEAQNAVQDPDPKPARHKAKPKSSEYSSQNSLTSRCSARRRE